LDDILIKGAKVFDGTGAPWFRADVAVVNGKIRAVAPHLNDEAGVIIDGEGKALAPGFIDSHSHSDITLLINPKAESKIRQGVTTEVIGQCGSSAAPVSQLSLEEAKKSLFDEEIDVTWRSMADYLSLLEKRGVAVNVVPTVGHGTIREAVVGYDDRRPTADELRQMKEFVAEAMEAGARAFTTGLIYPPGSYAETDELIELARVAAAHGGIYMSHIRNEEDGLLDAVAEAIEIGERGGLPVQISHHKAVGPTNWGRVKDSLAMIDAARARGLDVTVDQYPYVATSTGLSAIIPEWAHDGGTTKLLQRLKDGPTRAKIGLEVTRETEHRGGWDKILISSLRAEANRRYQGWTLDAIASDRRTDPWTTACDLIISEGGYVGMIRFGMSEDDVRTVIRHPAVMIGSDGSALAPYGRLGEGKPHPRNYGTFVRVLGKYAREEKVLTMSEAIRKMTGLPAARFGLWDRGLVRPGMAADLVLFDPETVAERASFTDPHQYPMGIDYVMVNGRVAVDPDGHTGTLAGRVLRGWGRR